MREIHYSTGRVVGYEKASRGYKGKLLAMGLMPGTEFIITRHDSLGDPIEIQVRDFKLRSRYSVRARFKTGIAIQLF